jgi:hypothetical protein
MNDHQRPGHEITDISIRAVVFFLIGLGGVLVCTGLGLWWFFGQMESYARSGDRPASPVARDESPPAPRLQVSAQQDLRALREDEERRLRSYGWVDRKDKVVHIPIDEAIERVSRDGLPRWPAVAAQPPEGQQP